MNSDNCDWRLFDPIGQIEFMWVNRILIWGTNMKKGECIREHATPTNTLVHDSYYLVGALNASFFFFYEEFL